MMMDYKQTVQEIKELYLSDKRPWIIGLSGGKDSTCVAQLVFYVIKDLPPEERIKEVHILSSDTLVESPYIQARIKKTCKNIEVQAKKDGLPIKVRVLRPELNDTFWVNLIGRGYPSPNRWFRWCTDRLKIRPVSKYILETVKENGEVVVLLGARKDESASRAQTMSKYAIENSRLRRHSDIPGAFIFTPIEDWNFKDVWAYLLQAQSPWGDNNRDLVTLYRKADGECPMVINKDTPACGGSRFGCWVCTVVDRDRSLEGLIEDGETWLEPLLELRNWLKIIRDDPSAREKTRKGETKKQLVAEKLGREFETQEHRGHKVLGPFTFETRHEVLRRLMKLQGSFESRGISLISPEELRAIETIWIYEGDEISSVGDVLFDISSSSVAINSTEKNGLYDLCEENGIPAGLIERLLMVESDLSSFSRRPGIYNKLEKVLEEYIFQIDAAGRG